MRGRDLGEQYGSQGIVIGIIGRNKAIIGTMGSVEGLDELNIKEAEERLVMIADMSSKLRLRPVQGGSSVGIYMSIKSRMAR